MQPGRSERGFTLIEAMLSLGILAVSLLGLAQMQIISVRSTHFARSTTVASGLGRDLVENMAMWRYDDARLAAPAKVDALDDGKVSELFDLGKDESVAKTEIPVAFSDSTASDPNVTTTNALGIYDGLASPEGFTRYWTPIEIDPDNDGVPDGKLVVVVVRWREPGFGFRQVVHTGYKANPGVVFH